MVYFTCTIQALRTCCPNWRVLSKVQYPQRFKIFITQAQTFFLPYPIFSQWNTASHCDSQWSCSSFRQVNRAPEASCLYFFHIRHPMTPAGRCVCLIFGTQTCSAMLVEFSQIPPQQAFSASSSFLPTHLLLVILSPESWMILVFTLIWLLMSSLQHSGSFGFQIMENSTQIG